MAKKDAELLLENVGNKVFKAYEDFEVFNELKETGVLLRDFDPENPRLLWANSAYLDWLGWSLAHLQGTDLSLANNTQKFIQYALELHDRVQVRKEVDQETRTVYPSGVPVTSHEYIRPIEVVFEGQSEPKTIIFTECVRVERSNEDAFEKSRFHELMRNTEVLAMIFDPSKNGESTFINAAAQGFYEKSIPQIEQAQQRTLKLMEVIDTCVFDTSQIRAEVIKKVNSITLASDTFEVEARKRHSISQYEHIEDLTRWHRMVFQPIVDPASGNLAVLVNEYDITELKKVQLDLSVINRKQEQFFATVTHELRTPLNAIIGLSESLLHDPILRQNHQGQQAMKTLNVIKNSGKHLAGLVNDILDLTSIKRQTLVLRDDEVELSEIARNVCDLLSSMCRSGVKLINNIESSLPLIPGDSGRINQIFTNLVNNAIKFTEQGSIVLTAQVVGEHVKLDFEDTGIGIPEEKLDDIWGAFKQVDMSTTRKFGGTGIGLSVVKALVEAHQGRIEVKSRHGGDKTGTTFTVFLPLMSDSISRTRSNPDESSNPLEARSPISKSRSDLTTTQNLTNDAFRLREHVNSSTAEAKGEATDYDAAEPPASQGSQGESYWRDLVVEATSILEITDSALLPKLRELKVAEEETRSLNAQIEDLQRELQDLQSNIQNTATPSSEADEVSEPILNGVGAFRHHSQIKGSYELMSLGAGDSSPLILDISLLPKGYKVTQCASGPEALSTMKRRGFVPDLVLLDTTHGVDWSDFCSELLSRYPCNTLPVVKVNLGAKECNDSPGLPPSKPGTKTAERATHRWLREEFDNGESPSWRLSDPQNGSQELELHDLAAVMVCEISAVFENLGTTVPHGVAEVYRDIYRAFDEIVLEVEDENVARQVRDSYLVVLGNLNAGQSPKSPKARSCQHTEKILSIANAIMTKFEDMEFEGLKAQGIEPKLTIGVGMGPVCGAMVGMREPDFSYFGPAVKQACDVMEHGPHTNIFATDDFVSTLKDGGAERFKLCGLVQECDIELRIQVMKGWNSEEAVAAALARGNMPEDLSDGLTQTSRSPELRDPENQGLDTSELDEFGLRIGNGAKGRGGSGWHESTTFSLSASMLQGPTQAAVRPNLRLRGSWDGNLDSEDMQRLPHDHMAEVARQKMMSLQISTPNIMNGDGQQQWTGAPKRQRAPSIIDVISKVGGQVTILSVDDDPINQMVVENLVAPMGYKIQSCMSGFEALEYIESHPDTLPDLVLLDVMMPGMSGFEFCRTVRQRYTRTQLPIIMVSAKNDEASVVEGLEDGCNDYVSKPFSRLELLARISTQLRLKEAWQSEVENARSTKLLQRMLPEHVISRLKNNPSLIVEEHKNITVLFSDIVGYTSLASQLPTLELIHMLNTMVCQFDDLLDQFGCYKVQIIGDGYMVVCGHDGRTDHASRMIRLALEMINIVKSIPLPRTPGKHVCIRVGIHTGPAVAGILGTKMPRYCFFGDTVNIAARMESHGYSNNIHVSESVVNEAKDQCRFFGLGEREIKGKGRMSTFLVQDQRCDVHQALSKSDQEAGTPQSTGQGGGSRFRNGLPRDLSTASHGSSFDDIFDEDAFGSSGSQVMGGKSLNSMSAVPGKSQEVSEAFRQSAVQVLRKRGSRAEPDMKESQHTFPELKGGAASPQKGPNPARGDSPDDETVSSQQAAAHRQLSTQPSVNHSRSSSPAGLNSPERAYGDCPRCMESSEREKKAIQREQEANDRAAAASDREQEALQREREANDRAWQASTREREALGREAETLRSVARYSRNGARASSPAARSRSPAERHTAMDNDRYEAQAREKRRDFSDSKSEGRASPNSRQCRTLPHRQSSPKGSRPPILDSLLGRHSPQPRRAAAARKSSNQPSPFTDPETPGSLGSPMSVRSRLGDLPGDDSVLKLLLERDALGIQREALNNTLQQKLLDHWLAPDADD